MALDPNEVSIVHWFPDLEKHKCGYCKQDECSISYGMWAETMTVRDYQNLIDRGWRRSGKYCYKPIMNETCCPQYTIRCDALNFTLSKSQKKVIKKFNKYLSDGIINKDKPSINVCYNDGHSDIIIKERPDFAVDLTKLNSKISETEASVTTDKSLSIDNAAGPSKIEMHEHRAAQNVSKKVKITKNDDVNSQNNNNKVKQGSGADPTKPPSRKAKLLRMEKKQKKLLERGLTLEVKEAKQNSEMTQVLEAKENVDKKQANNEIKSLRQFLNEIPCNSKHKLRTKLISTSRAEDEWVTNLDVEYAVYEKYQTIVHNDPPEKCSRQGFVRFLITTPLQINLVRMHLKHGLFKVTAELFAKYQMAIHNEPRHECSVKQFLEFLVETPFETESEGDGNGENSIEFGSFHQQYWIDDKLVAVGVIDILPNCISSVYFFYDPDYRNLTLGTYGSLCEIAFTQSLHEKIASIRHYYMGYYIHSCPKMRYKGKLSPSKLLCPETYGWFPIEQCVPNLNSCKYSRLNTNTSDLDKEACSEQDVDSIKILLGYNFTTFRNYKHRNRDKDLFEHIGKLVGKKCAASLLFVNLRH